MTGVAQAAAMVAAGVLENAVVIGAETLSGFTDYSDRRTCILFGDGAGGAVLTFDNPICFFQHRHDMVDFNLF